MLPSGEIRELRSSPIEVSAGRGSTRTPAGEKSFDRDRMAAPVSTRRAKVPATPSVTARRERFGARGTRLSATAVSATESSSVTGTFSR